MRWVGGGVCGCVLVEACFVYAFAAVYFVIVGKDKKAEHRKNV